MGGRFSSSAQDKPTGPGAPLPYPYPAGYFGGPGWPSLGYGGYPPHAPAMSYLGEDHTYPTPSGQGTDRMQLVLVPTWVPVDNPGKRRQLFASAAPLSEEPESQGRLGQVRTQPVGPSSRAAVNKVNSLVNKVNSLVNKVNSTPNDIRRRMPLQCPVGIYQALARNGWTVPSKRRTRSDHSRATMAIWVQFLAGTMLLLGMSGPFADSTGPQVRQPPTVMWQTSTMTTDELLTHVMTRAQYSRYSARSDPPSGADAAPGIDPPSISATEASNTVAEAMTAALSNAVSIIGKACTIPDKALLESRIAPLEFKDLGNAVMQTQSVFVLQNASLYGSPALDHVWVPLSLAIQLAVQRGDQAEVNYLKDQSKYDTFISVNTQNTAFAIGNSTCAWIRSDAAQTRDYYSTVSVLLHEMLHSLGIYSLVGADSGRGFMGYVSSYDAKIVVRDTKQRLFATQQLVTDLKGSAVGGQIVEVAGHRLYNPSVFRDGSSLSHLQEEAVMDPIATPNACEYELGSEEIEVLNELGWNCSLGRDTHSWSLHQPRYFDPTDMSNVRGGSTGDTTSTADHTVTTVTCAENKCLSLYWNRCVDCDTTTASDGVWFILMWVALSFCFIIVCFTGFGMMSEEPVWVTSWRSEPGGYRRRVVYEKVPASVAEQRLTEQQPLPQAQPENGPGRQAARCYEQEIRDLAFRPFSVL